MIFQSKMLISCGSVSLIPPKSTRLRHSDMFEVVHQGSGSEGTVTCKVSMRDLGSSDEFLYDMMDMSVVAINFNVIDEIY